MIDLAAWGYIGVLVAAAVPWLEILFVIPAGVAFGLDPLTVGLVAYIGNAVPVIAIVVAFDAIQRARARRADRADARELSGRAQRARRLLDRYGLPVLALSGPAVIGLHLAALIATQTRAARGRVAGWMLGSLAAWTVVVTALSAAGIGLLRG